MKKNSLKHLPTAVEEFKKEVDDWREKREHRRKAMPKELWRKAVLLAGEYGVSFLSKSCCLGYRKLKRLLKESKSDSEESGVALVKFVPVQVIEPPKLPIQKRVVEFVTPNGSQMKIELHDFEEIVGLAQAFLRCAS